MKHCYILDRSFCLFLIFKCLNTPQPIFGDCKNQIWLNIIKHTSTLLQACSRHFPKIWHACAGINHKTFRRVKVIHVHQHFRPKISKFNSYTSTKYTFTRYISVTNNNLVQTKKLRYPNNLNLFKGNIIILGQLLAYKPYLF